MAAVSPSVTQCVAGKKAPKSDSADMAQHSAGTSAHSIQHQTTPVKLKAPLWWSAAKYCAKPKSMEAST